MDALTIAAVMSQPLLAPPVKIVNYWSDGGSNSVNVSSSALLQGKLVTPNITAANTYTTVFQYSGGGIMRLAAVYANNNPAKKVKVRITIDDVVVFETPNLIDISYTWSAVVGIGGADCSFDYVPFRKNVKVEVLSDNTGTNISAILNYRLTS